MDMLLRAPEMKWEGNLSENWRRFRQAFDLFVTASGHDAKGPKLKTSMLLTCLGEKGIEVYNTFTVDTGKELDLATICVKFEEHFKPRKNTAFESYMFKNCKQGNRSIVDFITELHSIAKNCEFGDEKNRFIRDQLIFGVNDEGLRRRMLNKEDISLEEATEMARTSEVVTQQMHVIQRHEGQAPGFQQPVEVDAVNYRPRGRGRGNWSNQHRTFVNCSSCNGRHARFRCPAYRAECYQCGKQGHYSRCCSSNREERRRAIDAVQTFNVDSVRDEISSDDWIVNMTLNGVKFNTRIDTGAQANLICKDDILKLAEAGKKPFIHRTEIRLRSYSGHPIPVLGKCLINVNNSQLTFIVVDTPRKPLPIIGFRDTKTLGLISSINTIQEHSSTLTDTIFRDFPELFEGLGCIPGHFRLNLKKDAVPVVRPCTRIPFGMMPRLKEALTSMQDSTIIASVTEPTDWVNGLSLAEKKNGEIRVCLDPRPLNKCLLREHFSLPTREELMSRFAGAKVFSKIDCNSGFWQIQLDEESSYLTTFTTPFGRYRFLRLPYGVSSAPEHFHRRISEMFESEANAVTTMDDIVIFGHDQESHDKALFNVLNILKSNNVTLNKSKCSFGVTSVSFMGEILCSDGIKPDPTKVQAILDLKEPTNKTEVQRFIGMVNYLGRFIDGLSENTAVLRTLLHKNSEWKWDASHRNAWSKLKTLICTHPVLLFYDPNKDVKISADSSQHSLGAVLLQKDDKSEWRPVAYASRSLTGAETRYAQIEKELLAISFACVRFHQYVYGKINFTVETDHRPLINLFTKDLNKCPLRVQRIMLSLQKYDFTAVFVPGKHLYTADVLSRFVNNEVPSDKVTTTNNVDLFVNTIKSCVSVAVPEHLLSEISTATSKDNELCIVKSYVTSGWPKRRRDCDHNATTYWNFKDELSCVDGILFRGLRVVIPKVLRPRFLSQIHYGHLGISKCKARAREAVFWPGLTRDIISTVQSCVTCNKFQPQQCKEPLRPHPAPQYPFQRIAIDIFHHDYKDYLLLVDYYSGFPEVFKLNSTSTKAIVQFLTPVLSRYGSPELLISDNAANLISEDFEQFCRDWDVTHVTSSPFLSRSNGCAERAIRTCKQLIKKCNDTHQDFYRALQIFRTSPLSCGFSPSQLLMGRRIRSNLPVCTDLLKPTTDAINRNFNEEKKRYKSYYDVHTKPLSPLIANSNVIVYNCKTKMWDKHASVIRMISPRCYLVRTADGAIYKRNRVHLKPVSFSNASFNHLYDANVLPAVRRSERTSKRPDRFVP